MQYPEWTEQTTQTALEVTIRRPDLSGVGAVLMAEPQLTADQVIEILDEATEDARE